MSVGPLSSGDVISFRNPHTAVVTSVNIDNNGNGSFTTMDQNSLSTGYTYPVSNWHVTQSYAGDIVGWLHDTQSGASTSTTDAFVAKNANGTLAAFGRGTDNNIWYSYQTAINSSSWSSWSTIQSGATFNGDPAVGVFQGALQLFAWGFDNNIYHTGQGGPNGIWSTWQLWQTGYTFQGTPATANDANGNIEVLGWGSDSNIWHDVYLAGSGWTNWSTIQQGYKFNGA